jgi:DNA-binding response OmpR family regulator
MPRWPYHVGRGLRSPRPGCLLPRINELASARRGYVLETGETIPHSNAAMSGDMQSWQCRRPDKTTRCFFFPPLLALRQGGTITKEIIFAQMYAGIDQPAMKIIDVYICKLRKKLADASGGHEFIETVWGRGYGLREPGTQKIAM